MSRRRRSIKREVLPDLVFNSDLVTRFVNIVMKKGKKSTAERIVYSAIEKLAQRTKLESLESFEKAIDNIKPLLEVKSRRVGGATYQVPVEVAPERAVSLAMRWVVGFATKKTGSPLEHRLANELTDAFNRTGTSMKKREDTHRMAEANQAFAHYKW